MSEQRVLPVTSLAHLLVHRARNGAKQLAYRFLGSSGQEEGTLTYEELDREARKVALLLQQEGARGERVMLCYEPGLDYIVAFFGCVYAGAIAVPAYPPDFERPHRTMPRLKAIVNSARAAFVLTAASLKPQIGRLLTEHGTTSIVLSHEQAGALLPESLTLAPGEEDDPVFLMYTSGSTGRPKGVTVSHGNVLHNLSHFPGFEERPCTGVVSWLPLFHDLGLLLGVLHPLYQGVPATLMAPVTFVKHPYRWLEAISRYQASTTGGPNFAYDLCVQRIRPEERAQLDLSRWTMALNGAEPVRHETLARFTETFAPHGFRHEVHYPSFGMSEGTATVTGGSTFTAPRAVTLQRQALTRGSVVEAPPDSPASATLVGCGHTLPGQALIVVNPQTLRLCGPDEVGEIWVSGPSVAQGYWQEPEESERTFQAHPEGSHRGYLRTGDLGFLRDGELFLTGRLKDVIIIRGVNHHPEDLEHTIAQADPALRAGGGAAFSVEAAGQERVVIVQEANPQALQTADALFDAIRQRVAQGHDIEVWSIVLIQPGTLPKTSSGKISRYACRDAFLAGKLAALATWQAPVIEAAGGYDAPEPSAVAEAGGSEARIRGWLQHYFAQRQGLSPDEIDPRNPFISYGLNSLEAITLIHELEQWLGRPLSPTLAWNHPTIAALAHHLAGTMPAGVQAPLAGGALSQEPIAIIGMSCRFPGGVKEPEGLWSLLANGVDTVTEIPPERWNVDEYYHPQRDTPGKMVTRWGSYIQDLDQFDPAFFGISPREAAQLDPRQRLLLEGAWEALEDAGIPVGSLAGSRTGVFVSVLQDDYGKRLFEDYSVVNAYSGSGTANSPTANRLSYFLNSHGPSIAVDTACSGSLVAIHLACQSLRSGESTLALAGGVNIILKPDSDIFMSQAGIISQDGRCKTFDSRANGIVRAEGMGLVVLKPLSRALADGDPIHAVIRGSAINHNGRSNGLMAPNGQAQEMLVRAAWEQGGVTPDQVQYIEAHGTATTLGDPIEVTALGNLLAPTYPKGHYCAIGSVKSNIGHAEAAAGVAGLFKVIMAMKHRQLPPNLHFQEANPLIPFDQFPLAVQRSLSPWPRPEEPLIAGVSGFGFSGTNAHVVLEAAPERPPLAAAPTREVLLPLSARTAKALRDRVQQYSDYLSTQASASPYHIAYTASVRRTHLEHRLVVMGETREALLEQLQAFLRGEQRLGLAHHVLSQGREPKLLFVFSGQGTQWPRMGLELYEKDPVFRATLDACEALIQPLAGWSLLETLSSSKDPSRIDNTVVAQVAVFAVQVALAMLWRSWGIVPDAIVGQSLGEVAAAYAAGALSLEDALRVVYHRSRLMERVEGKGLTAVLGIPLEEANLVTMVFKDTVSVAGSSSPSSSLIAGEPEAVQRIVTSLQEQGVFARLVQGVTIAFHSRQMDPLVAELVESLRDIQPRAASTPLYSTVTGTCLEGPEMDAAYWGRNLREPFVFSTVMKQVIGAGFETFLEISPHPVLGGPIMQGLAAQGREGVVLPSLRREEAEWPQVLAALGALYVRGFAPNWHRLYPDEGQVVKLPPYPWQHEHYWLDQIDWTPLATQLVQKRGLSHPLLGEYTRAAVQPWQHFWEIDLDTYTIPYLSDHRVQGMAVMPGSAYIEMALAAARQSLGGDAYLVRELTFKEVLPLAGDEARRVQVVLTPEAPGDVTFQVFSRHPSQEVWVEHVRGTLNPQTSTQGGAQERLNLDEIRARCPAHLTRVEQNQMLAQPGLEYGPVFQVIDEIWYCEGEALGRLKLHESMVQGRDGYILHPTLLDGAFRVVAATMLDAPESEGMVLPVGIEKFVLRQPGLGNDLWCHARLLPAQRPDEYRASLTLVDEQGTILATLDALRLERVRSRQEETRFQQWFYEVRWQPQPLAESTPARRQPGSWILFASPEEGPTLQALIEAQGDRCHLVYPATQYQRHEDGSIELDPDSAEQYKRLFAEVLRIDAPPCRGIGHLWVNQAAEGELEQAQRLGVGSLLHLTQALLSEPRATGMPQLWLLTEQAQSIHPGERAHAARAALWGMGRVLSNEHPELRCTLIDLPAGGVAAAKEALSAELFARAAESQLALRAEGRYVARFTRYMPSREPDSLQGAIVSDTAPFKLEIETPGVLSTLKARAVTRARPGPGQVEVEMVAAGMNFKDVMLATGTLPPLPDGTIPLGLEGAGRVVAVGEGVSKVKVGDEVLLGADNCFSRYVLTDQHLVGLKPAHFSFEAAATIPVAFGTVCYAIKRLAHLRAGERILIHTASGAVGQAAIQLARLAGAEIYATAGTPEKRAFLREEMGIEHVLDSRTLDFADEIMALTHGEGVDVVLNTLSGAGITRSLALLRPYGRFLELGKRDIVQNSPLHMGALEKNISYFVVDFNQMMRDRPELVGEIIDQDLFPLFMEGRLQPISFQSFPISEADDAFRLMAQARHIGKVVLSLGEQRVTIAPSRDVTISSQATYLITGGLGGLGQVVAHSLVEQGARHLVLTSRRPREALSSQQSAFLSELESLGATVVVAQGDVASVEETAHLMAEIARSMPPLRGIIHSAGVLEDRLLLQMTPEQLSRVLAPKIQGSWNLHHLSQEAPLDFFVLFSSLASLLAPQGQANYAAGNAFMDALAQQRRAEGRPALSLNWGTWDEVGMAAQRQLQAQHSRGGVRPIPPQQGVAGLFALMASGATQVAVADIDWQQMRQSIPAGKEPPFLADLLSHESAHIVPEGAQSTFAHTALLPATPEERASLLAAHLQQLAAGVFHLDPARLDRHLPLNQMGIDSLMAVELKTKIEKSVGQVTVSIVDLLRNTSIMDLTQQLLDQLALTEVTPELSTLLAEAEALSPEELDALLNSF